jgi:hypothetical protein
MVSMPDSFQIWNWNGENLLTKMMDAKAVTERGIKAVAGIKAVTKRGIKAVTERGIASAFIISSQVMNILDAIFILLIHYLFISG